MAIMQPNDAGTREVAHALWAVAAEPRLTAAMRAAEDLRWAATRSTRPGPDARQLAAVVRHGDDLSAIAAIHALGAVDHGEADAILLDVVRDGSEPFSGHAIWALAARRSSPAAVEALHEARRDGGFTAMLAERTLVEWARSGQGARAGPARPVPPDTPSRGVESRWPPGRDGIVVIQPFLHARLDRAGSGLGAGDAGGIASLVRSLGSALAGVAGIDGVVTVTRRHDDEAAGEDLAPGHRVLRIGFGPPGELPWREGWAHRTRIERELSIIGEALAGRRVVWHLRMADVGTLAAYAVARRLGQAVVFTVAPDPHIVIDGLQDSDRLDRSTFAMEDAAAQFWFRARMVERLADQADRLVVLPRPGIEQELVDLVGVDPDDLRRRCRVIPEGVDVGAIEQARTRARPGGPAAVRRVLDALPPSRRALPWLLTVGRLHPTKGSPRLIQAVTAEAGLADEVNVVVVGGDIAHPSPDEQSTIERIRLAARDADPGLVTLTGHLPPGEVSDLMVFASEHGGVYVGASDKEEFGLAIVEALGAGLVVVAPERGGAPSYIRHGDTGVVCDTLSVGALGSAIGQARRMTGLPGRAERARSMVAAELSVETMADRLGELYRELLAAPVAV